MEQGRDGAKTPPEQPTGPGLLSLVGRWLGLKPGQHDLLRYLLLIGFLGLLYMLVGNLTPAAERTPEEPSNGFAVFGERSSPAPADEGLLAYERALAAEVQRVLAALDGAGRVEVTVRLRRGPERILAADAQTNSRRTEEHDSAGGTRVVTEVSESGQTVILRTGGAGADKPLVLREERPQIDGVLVVAEGAFDPVVRARLVRAAAVALGIHAHRVHVAPRGVEAP